MQNKLIMISVPAAFAASVLAVASFASAQMCTMDAMVCPDGSYVGRSGPNCEFVCPGGSVMPDQEYGTDVSVDGSVQYSGGSSGTVSVDASGIVEYHPSGCGGNGTLCPEFNNGTNVDGGSWYDHYTDPCTYTNWSWLNPCDSDQGGGYDDGAGGGGQNTYLSASQTFGAAPLMVAFSAGGLSSGSQYIIDFGDGHNSSPLLAPVHTSHTYAMDGTYTATLQSYAACMWSEPRCLMATQLLGSVTITVTGEGNDGFSNGSFNTTSVGIGGEVNADDSAVQAESSFSFSAFIQGLRSFFGF